MKFRRHTIMIFACAVAVFSVFLGTIVWQAKRSSSAAYAQLLTDIGEVRRIDEVLTSSALLATATGDRSYRDRYFRHVDLLDEALASSLAAFESEKARVMLRRTDEANKWLVAEENRALEMIDQPHSADRGYALLTSDAYVSYKAAYSDGVDGAFDALAEVAEQRVALMQRLLILYLIALLLVISLGLCVEMNRRAYRDKLTRRNEQLSKMRALIASFMDIQNNLLNNFIFFRTKAEYNLPFGAEDVEVIDREIETAKLHLEDLTQAANLETRDLGGIAILRNRRAGDRRAAPDAQAMQLAP